MGMKINLGAGRQAEFKALWDAGCAAADMAVAFELTTRNRVYYVAHKMGLAHRRGSPEAREQRAETSRRSWKQLNKRKQQPQPNPVTYAFAGSFALVRQLDQETRALVDEAMAAGRVQKLPSVDPDSPEAMLDRIRQVLK